MTNMSSDPEQEYLGAGMAEALIVDPAEIKARRARVMIGQLPALAGPLAVPAILAAEGRPPIGFIDFNGVRKASAERLREALGIREGDAVPNLDAEKEAIVKRLQRVRHVVRAAVGRICCHEGRSILSVGAEEKGAPRLTFRPRPSADIRLPEEISTIYDRFGEALAQFQARMGTVQ